MNTFYIPEIKLKDLNKKNIIQKLKKNLLFHEDNLQYILAFDGVYKIINGDIIKYKIIDKDYYIIENFLDKYSLLYTNKFFLKDKNIQYKIPYDHELHTFMRIYFYHAEYSKNKLVVDINDTTNQITDIYFVSNEKENDYNFKEDMSSFIEMLNV
jgi:hypothetical protein